MKIFSRVILVLSLVVAMVLPLVAVKPIEATTGSLTVYSSTSDSYAFARDAVYNTAWSATAASAKSSSYEYLIIGQNIQADGYYVVRSYLHFDTSAIPDSATITSATLQLYGAIDSSTTADFDITIQSGQPTYPHDPLVLGDYNKTYYSGDGGSLSTVAFITSGYNSISLNATGLSWINLAGVTKLCLRSSRDIAGTTSTNLEDVEVYSSDYIGTDHDPRLVIYYKMLPTVLTSAATSVTSENATVNGEITDIGGENATLRGFEWGTSSGNYSANWTEAGSFGVGTFSNSGNVTGLSANTTYYFRAFAQNSEGFGYGSELSFVTLPTASVTISVITNDATNITPTSAVLQGTLQSLSGLEYCSVSFQYGTTTSYGATTTETTVISTGTFSSQATGLRYNTTYHFRAIARFGTSYFYGADNTFTTIAATGSTTDLVIVSAAVFSNYKETGDLLVCVETINTYTSYYPNQKAGKYFTIQLLDTNGIDILAATPLSNWGDRPTAIYINASQAADLVPGSSYYVRMVGSLIPSVPYVDRQLQASDWQGYDPTALDDWCIGVAANMQVTDGRLDYLTVLTDRGVLIDDAAGGYFTTGIPDISQRHPNLFTTAQVVPSLTIGVANNVWDNTTAWVSYVGANIAADANAMALPFGITGKSFLAGMVAFVVLGCSIVVVGATGGFGAVGAVLIALPLIWLGTYFRVVPLFIVILLALAFMWAFVRQFIWKTL